MSDLDKIIDKVPYSDGGFRRRMTAGAIVNMGIGVAWVLSGNKVQIGLGDAKELVSSPLVAVVFFLLVYAVDGLVGVLADLFITRLTGNTAWAISLPMNMFQKRHKVIRLILRVLAFYPGIFFFLYFGWAKAMIGRSSYRWRDLEKQLKPRTRKHLKTYPEIVKDGLKDPFGKQGDIPWLYFANHGENDDVKALARKLENRNKDVLVIVTSMLVAILIVLSVYQPEKISENHLNTSLVIQPGIIVIQFTMLVAVAFLSSYFLLLKQSILTIVEYEAFASEVVTTAETHNDSIQPIPKTADPDGRSGSGGG